MKDRPWLWFWLAMFMNCCVLATGLLVVFRGSELIDQRGWGWGTVFVGLGGAVCGIAVSEFQAVFRDRPSRRGAR